MLDAVFADLPSLISCVPNRACAFDVKDFVCVALRAGESQRALSDARYGRALYALKY